jgi:hypothetical protein
MICACASREQNDNSQLPPAATSVTIDAVERERWRSASDIAWQLGLFHPRVPRYVMTINASIPLLAERTSVSRLSSSAVLNGYYVNTLRISCFTQHSVDRVCSTSTSHLGARGNPHAIHEHFWSFSATWLVLVSSSMYIAVGPRLLRDSLTVERHRGFLETILTGLQPR